MSEKASKEEPHVLVEAEKIIQKKQPGKGVHHPLAQPYEAPFRVSTHRRRAIVSLTDYWFEMLDRVRDLTQIEFRDEVTDMKREIDSLRISMATMNRELSSYKQTIDKLCETVYGSLSTQQTKATRVDELCKDYVDMVSTIEVVRRILLVEDSGVTTIWTIIDAPPFEDSLRTPIYEAQIKILSTLKENIPLDFYVLNLSEISEDEELESIVPSNAKLVWER